MTRAPHWAGYVAAYHEAHAGITEDLLACARDRAGRTPYDWLLAAVAASGTVLDLACGSGPVLRRLEGRPAAGVDRSAGELAAARRRASRTLPLVRGDAGALPVASGTVDAVTASMALMVLDPLEPVLAEVARVLRPGGRLVATVPTRPTAATGRPGSSLLSGEILRRLGQVGIPYPEPLDPESLSGRFADLGLALVEDATTVFVRPVAEEADAVLAVQSFYAPGATASQVSAATRALVDRVLRQPVELSYCIRRLVAARSDRP